MSEPLDRSITAVNLLETTAGLMAQTCALVAQTRDRRELLANADHAARCIARPRQTRVLARDFLALAARDARRRLADDDRLTRAEYVDALRLVGLFEQRAAAHFAAPRTPGW